MRSVPDWFFILGFILLFAWWCGPGARWARRNLWPRAGGFNRTMGWLFGLLVLLTFLAWTRGLLVGLVAGS